MNTFASYLLTANLLLVLGYASYHWLYRKEEHFQFNRLYLLAISVVAWLIPLFPWSSLVASAPDLSLVSTPLLDTWTFVSEEAFTVNKATASTPTLGTSDPRAWLPLLLAALGVIYLAVSGTLLIRFLVSLGTLFSLVRRFPREQKGDHVLLHADREISPFSFFKMIILNPNLYQQDQHELIYQHELVHARQWHNLDILIAELWCIVSWFNPLTWKMKDQIRQNLEFIADATVLKNGINPKIYQYCLLRLNVANKQQIQIANHFNQSLLKKRIIMMNSKKSPAKFSFKHLLLLPLLAIMALISWPLQSQVDYTGQFSYEKITESGATVSTTITLSEQNESEEGAEEKDYFTDAPINDGESLYGLVRADLTMEDFQIMKEEFAKRGVKIEASNINFTSEGLLSSIQIVLTQWNQTTVVRKMDNDGKAIEGFICLFFKHDKIEKTATIGMEYDFPSFTTPKTKTTFLLEKLTGVAAFSSKGDTYIKGNINIDDGEVSKVIHNMKKTQK